MNTLAQLFTAAGNVLKVSGAGFTCGHEPVHASTSGTCVRIDSEKEQWYCHSCQRGGGPVEALMSLQGLSRSEAQAALKDAQHQASAGDAKEKPTIADRLIALAVARATFVHDDYRTCRSRILTASAESLDPSIHEASYMYEKSDREGYKPLRRRFRRGGLRSAWGAVDCVDSDHSMSS